MNNLIGTRNDLVSDHTGVLVSCIGVEFQPLGYAAFGELVRINVYAENPMSLDLESLFICLGGCKPLVVGPMEFVTILKHAA
ncbi:MAG: hypothetical protein Q7U57_09595 [Methylovulum sp.]|nr:hypothetical protein [Methylovulum sp.]